jgi:hypothetical protein
MLNCIEVSRLLPEAQDRKLSTEERIALRLHLRRCAVCLELDRHLLLLRIFAPHFAKGDYGEISQARDSGKASGLCVTYDTKEHNQGVQIKAEKRRNSGVISSFELDVLAMRTVTEFGVQPTRIRKQGQRPRQALAATVRTFRPGSTAHWRRLHPRVSASDGWHNCSGSYELRRESLPALAPA